MLNYTPSEIWVIKGSCSVSVHMQQCVVWIMCSKADWNRFCLQVWNCQATSSRTRVTDVIEMECSVLKPMYWYFSIHGANASYWYVVREFTKLCVLHCIPKCTVENTINFIYLFQDFNPPQLLTCSFTTDSPLIPVSLRNRLLFVLYFRFHNFWRLELSNGSYKIITRFSVLLQEEDRQSVFLKFMFWITGNGRYTNMSNCKC